MPSKASTKRYSKKGARKASRKASKRSKKVCPVKRVSSYSRECDAGMMWRRGYCKPSSGKYVRGSCVRVPKPYTGPYLMTPTGQMVAAGPAMKAAEAVAEMIPLEAEAFDTQRELEAIRLKIRELSESRAIVVAKLQQNKVQHESMEQLAQKAEKEGNLKALDDYKKRLKEISEEDSSLMQQQVMFTAKINDYKQRESNLAPLEQIYLYY